MADAGTIRCNNSRSRFLVFRSIVYTGEVDRVFQRTHHHGLFIVWVFVGAKSFAGLSMVIASGEMWMKHNVCSIVSTPTHGLRISETFMANGNPEFQSIYFEQLAFVTGCPKLIFTRVQLVF